MTKRRLLQMMTLFMVITLNSIAQTHDVPGDYESIQQALDVSNPGDTIILQNGNYIENIVIEKPITITSLYAQTNDTLDIENTIIDGGQSGSVIQVLEVTSGDVNLNGITLTNGSGTLFLNSDLPNDSIYYFPHGGGMFIRNCFNIVLDHMNIANNVLPGINNGGGGLLSQSSTVNINHSKITDNIVASENFAGEGAGLCVFYTNLTINNSEIKRNISNNISSIGGQGIYANNSQISIGNTIISENNGSRASGIYSKNSKLELNNSELYNNTSFMAAGVIYILNESANETNIIMHNNFHNNITSSGGIILVDDAIINIDDCTFTDNHFGFEGGAINANYATINFTNSHIINNTATGNPTADGGGLLVYNSDIVMDNIEFNNNECIGNADLNSRGGAITMFFCNADLNNVRMSNNSAGIGAALYLNSSIINLNHVLIDSNNGLRGTAIHSAASTIRIISSTIVNNVSTEGAIHIYGDDFVFANTILWNEEGNEFYTEWNSVTSMVAFDHSDIRGLEDYFVNSDHCQITWVAGNVNQESLFEDEENGNYKLSNESPLIDAGTAYFEFNGQIIIDLNEDEYYGVAPDIGAYENYNFVGVNNNIVTHLYVYPNPMIKSVLLITDKNIEKIQLFDINGILVKENRGSKQINVQNLVRGVYILKAFDIEKNQYMKKLIKN